MADTPKRPNQFTQDLADEICSRLMSGVSLREVCRSDDMPYRARVHEWLNAYPDFSDQYARACEIRADEIFDEIFDIADNSENDWMDRKYPDGHAETVENGEAIRRSQMRIDARKWALSKMQPKKYGDKLALDHGTLTVTIAAPDADL